MKTLANGLSVADHRALIKIERSAKEVLRQCEFLRRNASQGHDDCLRFQLILDDSVVAGMVSKKALKRYFKIRGW